MQFSLTLANGQEGADMVMFRLTIAADGQVIRAHNLPIDDQPIRIVGFRHGTKVISWQEYAANGSTNILGYRIIQQLGAGSEQDSGEFGVVRVGGE